jgi:hypothetical protein
MTKRNGRRMRTRENHEKNKYEKYNKTLFSWTWQEIWVSEDLVFST